MTNDRESETVTLSGALTEPSRANLSVVILDSTRGTRHLDNTLSSPSSLKPVESSRTVLDWILHALSSYGVGHVTYVGSYQIQKVIERYPSLGYRFQTNPRRGGEAAGLGLARPPENCDCLVVRASTILVPQALTRLSNPDEGLSVGYYDDGHIQRFVGLISMSASQVENAFDVAESLSRRDQTGDLEEWLSVMAAQGFSLRTVDLDALAAPIHDTVAVARTVFGGKGRTLEQVRPLVRSGTVLEQVRFPASDWVTDDSPILGQIQRVFPASQVVVRSSAGSEDGLEESLAGRFTSVLDVPTGNLDQLREAVDRVVGSYTTEGRVPHGMDEVLVQPHISNLAVSGVLLTKDPASGAPYYVLNIDRHSGRSDSVTSGTDVNVDTVYVSRIADIDSLDADVGACITLAQELEDLTHLPSLDIEFGITKDGTVYLFQVRPIAGTHRTFELADDDLAQELHRVSEFLDSHFRRHPTLVGKTTVLGTMPDWNPAEMIGTAPRPLALSLYQRLIGAEAWSGARVAIGYRDVRPEPLIVSLGGQPYVDARASLNSFLPTDLDNATAETWVDHCIDLLRGNPRLHDKIEFEVAITCLDFDFENQAQRLRQAGLGENQIGDVRQQLLRLTDSAITGNAAPNAASREAQFDGLKELQRRRRNWTGETQSDAPALARRINALLADCERYGVIPFAVLARYAFMSINLLRSLVTARVFSENECETLLRSIPTVASDLTRDFAQHADGAMSKEDLLELYGHLRPSSYDITSPNYANALDIYINRNGATPSEAAYPDKSQAEEIFDSHGAEIGALLSNFGFSATSGQLRSFILESIPGREWAKFELMKSVDAALEAIAHFGQILGFSRDDMSFLPIDMVVRGANESANSAVGTEFRRAIEFNKKRWNLTSAIRLPHLVTSTADTSAFLLEEWTPNFVSAQRVVAPPVVVDAGFPETSLEGCIVLIRAADPGYDWIFSHPIAGLITEYGGVASHMAIRAAEFGLPAAIGCGQRIFDWLRSASLVELDCTNRKVRALS